MANILVVDDEPLNRELVRAYLDGLDHTLFEASRGEEALARVADSNLDLVLLDAMMPGMDGFEVARQIKQNSIEFLPVIMLTALNDRESRVRALGLGVDEFLTKPIDRQELLLRVGNLLRLRARETELLRRNAEHVELHRFKDELSAMIVHDLRNPLFAVLGNLNAILDEGVMEGGDIGAPLRDSRAAASRALRLVENLLDIARIEAGRLELHRQAVKVDDLVSRVLRERAVMTQNRGIAVKVALDKAPAVDVDPDLITRVLANLIENSLRYTPPGGRIGVSGDVAGPRLNLHIGNTGPAIPMEARQLIFEKFGQLSPHAGRSHLGLGLYFCRLAAEAHGGSIRVEETPDLPAMFSLDLPLAV